MIVKGEVGSSKCIEKGIFVKKTFFLIMLNEVLKSCEKWYQVDVKTDVKQEKKTTVSLWVYTFNTWNRMWKECVFSHQTWLCPLIIGVGGRVLIKKKKI